MINAMDPKNKESKITATAAISNPGIDNFIPPTKERDKTKMITAPIRPIYVEERILEVAYSTLVKGPTSICSYMACLLSVQSKVPDKSEPFIAVKAIKPTARNC
jgi:hypothetical protein